MNPKKSKSLYKDTADQLNQSEELVKDVVELYWKDIRKMITTLAHPAIFVHGLGTFKAKSWKVAEIREKYEKKLSYNDGSTFRKMTIKTELEERIARIKLLQEQIQSDKDKKQSIKDKRYDKKNMEEQVVNTGGDVEQPTQERSGGEDLCEEDEDM